MALLSPSIMGWRQVVDLSACVVLAVTCLSQWPAICCDRHQARCYPKNRHCDSWAPFQTLLPRNCMKLPGNQVLSSVLSGSILNTSSNWKSADGQVKAPSQAPRGQWWAAQQATAVLCRSSMVRILLGGSRSCSRARQLLKPGDTAGDCPGVLCLQWGR